MKSLLPSIAMMVLVSACAHQVPRATENGTLKDSWKQISDDTYIRVRGVGAAPIWAVNQTQRRAHSRNASLVAARYQLLGVVRGLKLEGGISVGQLMEKDDLIREIANEIVSGGEEILTEWTADGGCVTTLELRRDQVQRLIQKKTKYETDLELQNDLLVRDHVFGAWGLRVGDCPQAKTVDQCLAHVEENKVYGTPEQKRDLWTRDIRKRTPRTHIRVGDMTDDEKKDALGWQRPKTLITMSAEEFEMWLGQRPVDREEWNRDMTGHY